MSGAFQEASSTPASDSRPRRSSICFGSRTIPPTPGPDFDEDACQEYGEHAYVQTVDADRPVSYRSCWIAYWNNHFRALDDSIDPSSPYANVEADVRVSDISELTRNVTNQVACGSLTTDTNLTLSGAAQPKDADIDGICVEVNGVAYVFPPGGGFRQR